MNEVSFFTPIVYNKPTILGFVDNYFYLRGRKAHVIDKDTVVLLEGKASLLGKIAKGFSYATLAIPLLMLALKTALRVTHTFKEIDVEKQMALTNAEKGAAKIKRLMTIIRKGEAHPEIEWLSKKEGTRVFRLKEFPDIVYKKGQWGEIDDRFQNTLKAKKVCMAYKLDLLVVPKIKKFSIEGDCFVAEERLDIEPHESAQEERYRELADKLTETAEQIAKFVAYSGFDDVTWRNIPILEKPGPEGQPQVGLVDLEFMGGAEGGFYGAVHKSVGLIGCMPTARLMDVVIRVGLKLGVIEKSRAEENKTFHVHRLKKWEEYRRPESLREFYKAKGITGKKKILVTDLNSLGLGNLDEKSTISNGTVTLRQVAREVIDEINGGIQENTDITSAAAQRFVILDLDEELSPYKWLGAPPGLCLDEKDEKHLWLRRIIKALMERGHLYKLQRTIEGSAYYLQA